MIENIKKPNSIANKGTMRVGKRGQISYEYLVIVGMMFFLVIPFFNYAFFSLGGNLMVTSGVAEAMLLAATLEEVSYLGPGNMMTVRLDHVESVTVQSGVVVAVLSKDGKEIVIPSTTLVTTQPLDRGQIIVGNNQGTLVVTNIPQFIDYQPDDITAKKITAEGKYFDTNPLLHIVGTTENGQPIDREYTGSGTSRTQATFSMNPRMRDGDYQMRICLGSFDSICSDPLHGGSLFTTPV